MRRFSRAKRTSQESTDSTTETPPRSGIFQRLKGSQSSRNPDQCTPHGSPEHAMPNVDINITPAPEEEFLAMSPKSVEKVDWSGHYPVGELEPERLETLRAFNVLDTSPELSFDRITSIAKRIFHTEIVLVSLVDEDRQWFKSHQGLPNCRQTDREPAFCNYVILPTSPDVFVVLDSHKDERFRKSALVTGPPYIRFYAGSPIMTKSVRSDKLVKLGALCCISTKPRQHFSIEDKMALTDLAGLVADELHLRNEAAQSLIRLKQEYITNVAHTLKTPLTAFQLSVDLLRETKLDPQQKLLIEQSRHNLHHMQMTIQNVQNMEAGCCKDGHGTLNIKSLVRTVKDRMNMFPKQVPIVYEIASDCPESIVTDGEAIRQCIANLLANSCKYTVKGGIKCVLENADTTRVTNIAPDTVVLRVKVLDTGCGLTDEVKEHLFKPFFQGQGGKYDGSTTNLGEGTGLGLHIVKTKLEALNGYCEAGDNPHGQGAMFLFEVPSMARPDTVPHELTSLGGTFRGLSDKQSMTRLFSSNSNLGSQAQSVTSARSGKDLPRALVVDDSTSVRRLLVKFLEKQGMEVHEATNGVEGLEMLKSVCSPGYVLVLMDFLMPVMNGIECVKQFREFERGEGKARDVVSPLIYGISANAQTPDIEEGERVGMDGFLPKPTKLQKLKEVVKKATVLAEEAHCDKDDKDSEPLC